MERSAIYRRALAPVMTWNGILGMFGAVGGRLAGLDTARGFIGFWAAVAALALAGSFFLVRRQALKESEPFWSPPTRRVTQAMLPALFTGLILGVLGFFWTPTVAQTPETLTTMSWVPIGWVILYGCAIHSAGFFMPRGMKIFGWAFVIAGCGLLAAGTPDLKHSDYSYGIMGCFFGVLHLAYGVYLYFSEKRRDET